MYTLEDSIKTLKGIGDKTLRLYERLSLYSLWDLLFYFPRTYEEYPHVLSDFSDVSENEKVAIPLTVTELPKNVKTRRMEITTLNGFYKDVPVELVWFRSPYIKNQLQRGQTYIFYGKLASEGAFKKKMEQPIIFTEEKYEKVRSSLQPIYGLTKGLTNNALKKQMQTVLDDVEIKEYLPASYLKKRGLIGFSSAISRIHFPNTFDELKEARNRLVYDEFLSFLIEMERGKLTEEAIPNTFSLSKDAYYKKCLDSLPFELTKGQSSCLEDLLSDVKGDYITQRLIQGDVGSGKTILAFLIMTLFVENGYQSAIMAPTEILAKQHYDTFLSYIKRFDLPFEAHLLVGSMTQKEKKTCYEVLSSGKPCFVIGTNALVQEKANFSGLGLVITDEQHRFGVKQRDTLRKKGVNPFCVVMSATPIPRTLSMILYGDMNISVISDVPKNRLPIKNAVITKKELTTAYQLIYKEVERGHQVYVICPLVEASEKTESENVEDYGKKLSGLFGSKIHVGILHGKMAAEEKQSVMEAFLNKDIDVLCSTTVVEVGVNVPNATVMLIEDAHRFGLAALHQLRGRVGRGDAQSYCIFVDGGKNKEPNKRLEVLNKSNDGFYIAGEDLKLRGPGDFYGIRQSGDFDFVLADVYQDADVLQMASEDAKEILHRDPELSSFEFMTLKEFLSQKSSHQYTNL